MIIMFIHSYICNRHVIFKKLKLAMFYSRGLHHAMINFLTYILVKGDVIGEYTGIGHGFM